MKLLIIVQFISIKKFRLKTQSMTNKSILIIDSAVISDAVIKELVREFSAICWYCCQYFFFHIPILGSDEKPNSPHPIVQFYLLEMESYVYPSRGTLYFSYIFFFARFILILYFDFH